MASNRQRIFTFRDLKEWGWPYSRQHTHRLIAAARFPKPKKLPGGATNIWTEQQLAEFMTTLAATGDDPSKSDSDALNSVRRGR
jgi:hypothetical protein